MGKNKSLWGDEVKTFDWEKAKFLLIGIEAGEYVEK